MICEIENRNLVTEAIGGMKQLRRSPLGLVEHT